MQVCCILSAVAKKRSRRLLAFETSLGPFFCVHGWLVFYTIACNPGHFRMTSDRKHGRAFYHPVSSIFHKNQWVVDPDVSRQLLFQNQAVFS
jgi:hypothetical protein